MTDDIQKIMETLGNCVLQRDRFKAALAKIANINNGPDRASGEWRCREAAAIAAEALKG